MRIRVRMSSNAKKAKLTSRSGGHNGETAENRKAKKKDEGNNGHLPLTGQRAKLIHDFKMAHPFREFANHGEWIEGLFTFLHEKDPEIKYEDLVYWNEQNQWISTFEDGGKRRREPWPAEFESVPSEADTEAMDYIPIDNSDSSIRNLVPDSSPEVGPVGDSTTNFEIASVSGGASLVPDDNLEPTVNSASPMAGTSASFYPMLRPRTLSSGEVLRHPPLSEDEETDIVMIPSEPEYGLHSAKAPNSTNVQCSQDKETESDLDKLDAYELVLLAIENVSQIRDICKVLQITSANKNVLPLLNTLLRFHSNMVNGNTEASAKR